MTTNSKETQKRADARRAGRSRNWATVVYPESAPDGWETKLAELKIAGFRSPEHKDDVNPDGEHKKPHYHVLMKFSVMKTREQILDLVSQFGGVGAERIADFRQYARYLCHLDNPEKAQYDVNDVRAFGGADYLTVIAAPSDKYILIGDMIDFCEANSIYSYRQLMIYARQNKPDWFRCLCDTATYVIKEYLKSAYMEDRTGGYTLTSKKKGDQK